MSPEQAAEQMSLVGHDFFVFVNDETDETSVLYKRGDGQFGLIEPTALRRRSARLEEALLSVGWILTGRRSPPAHRSVFYAHRPAI